MKKLIKILIITLISIHFLLLAYFLLFRHYFQQDEWHSFGLILSLGSRYISSDKSILELILGNRVGARIIAFSLFKIFKLNPFPYGLFALVIHSANTFLVFLLSKKMTRTYEIGLLSALFFLVNEVGNEAYSWFGTMTGSATALFFFLLSILFFFRFIETKKYLFNIVSLFLLWFSFLFKETALFAFILYPIILWIYSSKNKNKLRNFIKAQLPFIILSSIMIVFFIKIVIFIPGERANYVNTGKTLLPTIILNGVRYSSEGVIHTLIPNYFTFILSDGFTRIFNRSLSPETIEFLVAVQDRNAEITVVLLLILFIFIILFLLRKEGYSITKVTKKAIFVSAIMTGLSFIPYAVLNRSFAYLDSRHYYTAAVGSSILLSTIIFKFIGTKNLVRKICSIIIILSFLLIHENTLYSDFKLLVERAVERKNFLQQLDKLVPQLSKRTVFFIQGNSVGYYGLPELKVPFQSGFGHTLMVNYAVKDQLNPDFFKEETAVKALDVGFLYDILAQGYREIKGQGFGYYYNKDELKKALKKKEFTQADVISLYYFSETQNLKLQKF